MNFTVNFTVTLATTSTKATKLSIKIVQVKRDHYIIIIQPYMTRTCERYLTLVECIREGGKWIQKVKPKAKYR